MCTNTPSPKTLFTKELLPFNPDHDLPMIPQGRYKKCHSEVTTLLRSSLLLTQQAPQSGMGPMTQVGPAISAHHRHTGWQNSLFHASFFSGKKKQYQNRIPLPGRNHFFASHKLWQNVFYIIVILLVPLSSD
jgi:hypothetical protein